MTESGKDGRRKDRRSGAAGMRLTSMAPKIGEVWQLGQTLVAVGEKLGSRWQQRVESRWRWTMVLETLARCALIHGRGRPER